MSTVRHITVSDDDDGQRLDRWLKKRLPEIPYGLVQKLIRKGQLRVDGKRAKADMKLSAGQDVRIPPVEDKPKNTKPKLSSEDISFMRSLVIHDDGEILALNKPPGLAVQGGTKTRRHIDGMLDALKDKAGNRPKLVHRLDKDTTGVLLLARSTKAAAALGRAFKGRRVKKIYWAVVTPTPEVRQGTIKAPLIKSGGHEKEKMVVDDKEGKFAVTEYTVVEDANGQFAFMAFWPRTGRTHQIRAHAALMECPVLGDRKYGGPEARIEGLEYGRGMHLHAQRIIMPHPMKKGVLDIRAPLPPELASSWKALGFNAKYKEDPFEDLDG